MNWLLDFFYCRSWKEFFALMAVGSALLIVLWFLIAAAIILWG